jgi:hypothetical protein
MLKNTLNATYKPYAIKCWSDSLSMFGGGTDLRIIETKNGSKSYSYLGATYELPQGYNEE